MKCTPLETVDTLAARMGVPRRTIVREVMRCRLPYVSIAGHWRFRERDIEVWLERVGALPRMRLMRGGAPAAASGPPSCSPSSSDGGAGEPPVASRLPRS